MGLNDFVPYCICSCVAISCSILWIPAATPGQIDQEQDLNCKREQSAQNRIPLIEFLIVDGNVPHDDVRSEIQQTETQ